MNNNYNHYYPQPPPQHPAAYPAPYPSPHLDQLQLQQQQQQQLQQQRLYTQPPPASYPTQYAPAMSTNPRQSFGGGPLPPPGPSLSIATPAAAHSYSYGHLQQDDMHTYPSQPIYMSHLSPEYMVGPTGQQVVLRDANSVVSTTLGRENDPASVVVDSKMKSKKSQLPKKAEASKVEKGSFSRAFCERGKCGPCLFSCCCPQCAAAQARSHLDGSSCCFNIFCVNPFVVRWLVRSTYNIPGSAWEDLLLTLCCPICSINQVYQTTIDKGSPVKSKVFTEDHKFGANCEGEEYVFNCIYSLFCSPCIVGHTLETAFDMPYCLGFCCVNVCVMSSLVRHHYRISGSSCFDDIMPHVCKYFAAGMACMCPCGWKFLVSYVNNATLGSMHIAEDNRIKQPRYLFP